MNDPETIEFGADRVRISGPRIDGTYVVSLEVGEYQRKNLKAILDLPDDESLIILIKKYNGRKEEAKEKPEGNDSAA